MILSVQHWLRIAVLLLVPGLYACGGGGSSPSVSVQEPDSAQTVTTSIASVKTGQNYGLQIYLPQGYQAGLKRYPVIYAMDGTVANSYSRFNMLKDVVNRNGYNNVILVALNSISTTRRFVDFTMPGAQAYYAFLTSELIPMIDAQYRTDPKNRTLSGHSLSAEFALFALYQELPEKRFFSAILSADCSCWIKDDFSLAPQWDVPINMEQAMFERSQNLPVKLAISGSLSFNAQRAMDVYQRITQHGYQGLSAQFTSYISGHTEMDEPEFGNALKFVFGPPPR